MNGVRIYNQRKHRFVSSVQGRNRRFVQKECKPIEGKKGGGRGEGGKRNTYRIIYLFLMCNFGDTRVPALEEAVCIIMHRRRRRSEEKSFFAESFFAFSFSLQSYLGDSASNLLWTASSRAAQSSSPPPTREGGSGTPSQGPGKKRNTFLICFQ